jgi:hypothetical protein
MPSALWRFVVIDRSLPILLLSAARWWLVAVDLRCRGSLLLLMFVAADGFGRRCG